MTERLQITESILNGSYELLRIDTLLCNTLSAF